MSRENVEIVRELFAGWSTGDFRQVDFFDEDLEFIIDAAVTPTPGTWSGVEGMRSAWREQLSVWEEYRTGPIEHMLESGDDLVVAFNRLHGRGKSSGVSAHSNLWAAVFTFRKGKILRLLLTDLQGALDAVGLRE
jgi:ketosteroid isomerase-like protein